MKPTHRPTLIKAPRSTRTKQVHKKKVYDKEQYITPGRFACLFQHCIESGEPAYYRKGTFVDKLVWDRVQYLCTHQAKNMKPEERTKFMFLYGKVRADAKDFLKSHPPVQPSPYPVNDTNPRYRNRLDVPFAGADMNHAYWRIAFLEGIITERTYHMGLANNQRETKLLKNVRNSALSTMGKAADYTIIKGGKLTERKLAIGSATGPKQSQQMQNLYLHIRYTCFRHMRNLKYMLGEDFILYQTDGIYYVDSEENRELVRRYMNEAGLFFKEIRDGKPPPPDWMDLPKA